MDHYLKVVECAIEHDSKFLVIQIPQGKHTSGKLSFPGGKEDQSDHKNQWDVLRSAAKREVQEELGLNLIDPLKYITSQYFVTDFDGSHGMLTLFHCIIEKTDLMIRPSPREVDDFFWLSPDEIDQTPNTVGWLKKLVQCIRGENMEIQKK